MDDAGIVELYLAKNEAAIALTAEKYGAKLKRIAKSILNDEHEAEECENETYLTAWNSIPPHEPRSYLFAFLGRIVRNAALDHCRRSAAQKRSAQLVALTAEMAECLPSSESVEDGVIGSELSKSISRFLNTQSEQKRNAFVRRYWYFDSIAEISERLNISESRIKTMLFRLRKQLKNQLESEGYSI